MLDYAVRRAHDLHLFYDLIKTIYTELTQKKEGNRPLSLPKPRLDIRENPAMSSPVPCPLPDEMTNA